MTQHETNQSCTLFY